LPTNQLPAQPVAYAPPSQPTPVAQPSMPARTISQQQVTTKPPPTASPAFTSPPNAMQEPGIQQTHFNNPPDIRPIAEASPNVYAPRLDPPAAQQTAVPLFPSVPQSDPQVYESYSSRLNGTKQSERKEALLIDL
jgi:hypothetical protein